MSLLKESEEVRLLPQRHVLTDKRRKYRKTTIKMAYEVSTLYHIHMPLYFVGTFTEYPTVN